MDRIRAYIRDNPLTWSLDHLNAQGDADGPPSDVHMTGGQVVRVGAVREPPLR